jgi:hypothetical protein
MASVSENVAQSFLYQAAVRIAIVSCSSRCFANKVTSEYNARMAGVVRAMARSDHWRWVSRPGMDFFECDLDLPALNKPSHYLLRLDLLLGTKVRLRREPAGWVAYENPAQRHYWCADVIPDCSAASDFNIARSLAIPARHSYRAPLSTRGIQHSLQPGLSRALAPWASCRPW